MRVVLFTGKGGVGKTTAAAGTAALAARTGRRTLVLSTDPAHSLGDAFGLPSGPEPAPVAENLWVQQLDCQRRFEQRWADIQGYLVGVLDAAGVDPIAAQELTVLPGAEEVLALLELRAHALGDAWDAVLLDCAPTAETLRLLALPEALGWYLDRVYPAERRAVRALGPLLARAGGVPMPPPAVLGAVERLHADLAEVQELLTGKRCSVRLVLTPETLVVAEARRSLTTLSLFGYQVDGVIANRVFPGPGADAWRAGWVAAQAAVLAEVEQSFAQLPVWRSSFRPGEPVGLADLTALAEEAYGADDPLAPAPGDAPVSLVREGEGAVLRVRLPFVDRTEVDLARRGDELAVTVGSYRRLLALPSALRALEVVSAAMAEGSLRVRFGPAAAS